MATFAETFESIKAEMTKLGLSYDEALLEKVTKSLGPTIYNTDTSKVSCSDKSELETVKNNFLIKKLGMTDGPKLDAALQKACETLGSSNRNKLRAIFYYLLVKDLGAESHY